MTKTDLFNRALSKLGERVYAADTPAAQYLDMWRAPSIRTILEGPGYFSFTLAAADLRDTDEAPGMYPMPADAMRVIETGSGDFRRVGDFIVAAPRQIIPITYISSAYADREELPDSHEQFNSAVIAMLAANVCVPITSKHDLRQLLITEAVRFRREALHNDAVQYASNDQDQ